MINTSQHITIIIRSLHINNFVITSNINQSNAQTTLNQTIKSSKSSFLPSHQLSFNSLLSSPSLTHFSLSPSPSPLSLSLSFFFFLFSADIIHFPLISCYTSSSFLQAFNICCSLYLFDYFPLNSTHCITSADYHLPVTFFLPSTHSFLVSLVLSSTSFLCLFFCQNQQHSCINTNQSINQSTNQTNKSTIK